MLNWPRKNGQAFGMGREEEEKREVSLEGETMYQVEEEEVLACTWGPEAAPCGGPIRVDHERLHMPG